MSTKRCSGDSWWTRPFGQKDSHVLAGKGWECPGTETIHLDGPTIKASTNPECPDKEPILGVPSSCITQADIEKAEERKAAKKKKKKPLACRNGTWSPNHPQCKESESAITSPMDMD